MISSHKEILITENTLLSDIQSAFNDHYPFLKIEFWQLHNGTVNGQQKPKKIIAEISVKEVAKSQMPAILNIGHKKTIAQIEQEVKSILGLTVQFSRKSGNVWNAITLTDSWTLEDQNDAGKFISSEMSLPPTGS
ncbi:hypothetical protein I5907_17960 [Panacibacter sp. DH6]|uniref:Uncharacterized protein n=1 Tax=Panacibacter microcysteis TaxID=2793269 RepID=A0A931MD14_9BACT|nr:hypothetical protein [Panacibacter microcysteis]MBG9378128.1 hypothetical protein [Panacibacter microcysteis]